MKKIFSKSAAKGTSLIELIIYISILSIVLLSMTVFLVSNKKMEGRYKAMMEVEIQGSEIMRIVTQSIRNAQSVGSPAVGTNGASISLVESASVKNPTVFDLAGGKIRMKEGSVSATDLNSGQVSISNLNFKNMSSVNAPGSVRVSFDVSYVNPGNRAESNYSKKYVDSASIPQ